MQAIGNNLKWYDQQTGGTMFANAPGVSSANPGTFYFYVSQTNSSGCESDRAKITINISEVVKAEIAIDKDTVCQYDTISVVCVGSNPATSIFTWGFYSWDFENGKVLSGSSGGPYKILINKIGERSVTLHVINGGCHDSSVRTVFVKDAPEAIFELKDDVCVGDSLELKPYWIEYAKYAWSFDGGVIIDTTRYNTYDIKWTSSGEKTVSLKIAGKNGCSSPKRVHTVNVHASPEVSITNVSRNDICSGDTITLSASYNSDYTYQWLDPHYFITNNANEALAEIPKAGNVFIKVKDTWGCTGLDSVFINAKPCCDITLPDAFTPNGDGRNDIFHILTIGHHKIKSFYIANRWGQHVFETKDEMQGWDGTFRGVPQDMGTYFYFIKYNCSNDQVMEKNGEVILIR